MATVRARVQVEGRISDAEALWYDLSRWPSFIDGFAALVEQSGEWPDRGARLTWKSTPAGRGRVTETVTEYEPRVGQTVRVEDPRLNGNQRIAFAAQEGDIVDVTLELAYALRDPGFGGPLVDLLFVRRALSDSLRRTLNRYARELDAERELAAEGEPPEPLSR